MLSTRSGAGATLTPPPAFIAVLLAAIATLAISYTFVSGSAIALIVALIVALGLALLVLPTWISVIIYYSYSALSPLLKFAASYNTIVHLGPVLILVPIILHWGAGLANKRFDGKERTPLPVSTPVVLFVVLACLLVFAPMTTPLLALGGVISYILPIVFFPLIAAEFRTRRRVIIFLAMTLIASLLGAALTIVFVAIGPAQVARLGPGFAKAALDPTNVYTDPVTHLSNAFPISVVGGLVEYMIAVPLLVALLIGFRGALTRAAVLGLGVPAVMVLLVSLVASGVRDTLAGAVIGLLVVALSGRRKAILPVLIGALFFNLALSAVGTLTGGAAVVRAATLFDPAQALTSSSRSGLLGQIVPLAVQQPLGQGMGRVGPGVGAVAQLAGVTNVTAGAGGDNMILSIVAEMGAGGGILLLLIALLFMRESWRVYARLSDPLLKSTALGCLAGIVALASTFIAGQTLMSAPGSIYFWGLAGLCFALPHVEKAEQEAPAPSPPLLRRLA